MNIIKTNLVFGALTKRTKTTKAVWHNSGVTVLQSVEIIHNYHKNTNGWAGIGYHFYIRKDGSIYEGRPLDTVGAHAYGSNSDSIGMCFEGNFDKEQMTPEQIESGKWLSSYIRNIYPNITFCGHRDVCKTSCPGANFKFDEIVNGQPATPVEPEKEQIAEDGKWGRETTIKAQKVFGTPVDGIVSNQYARYKNQNKGLLSSTFEWKDNPNQNGSVLIGAIQRWVGVKEDRFIGPDTIRGMQEKLGTPVDGFISDPSVVIKAFQKWLNAQ